MHFISFKNYGRCGRTEGKTQSHNYSLHQRAEVAKLVLRFLCARNGLGLVNCLNFPMAPSCLLSHILCTCCDTEVGYKNEGLQKDTTSVIIPFPWTFLISFASVSGSSLCGLLLGSSKFHSQVGPSKSSLSCMVGKIIEDNVKIDINACPLMTNTA